MLTIAYNEIIKKVKNNFLIVLMIGIVMYIVGLVSSTYTFQSAKYEPLKSITSGKGNVVSLEGGVAIENSEAPFSKGISKLKNISYPMVGYGKTSDNKEINIYGYDDIISKYISALKEGDWYTDIKKEGYFVGVATENVLGAKVGNVVTLKTDSGSEYNVYISGILAEGAFAYNVMNINANKSFFDLYHETQTTNEFGEDVGLIIMHQDDLLQFDSSFAPGGNILVQYEDDITQEEIENNIAYYNQNNAVIIQDYKELRKETNDIIWKKIMRLLPMCICAIVFVIMGVVCITAIDTISNIKQDSVLYMCGITNHQYMTITIIKGLILSVVSFFIMLILSNVFGRWIPQELAIFKVDMNQILLCFGIAFFYVAIMLIVRLLIFKRMSIVKIMREAV